MRGKSKLLVAENILNLIRLEVNLFRLRPLFSQLSPQQALYFPKSRNKSAQSGYKNHPLPQQKLMPAKDCFKI